MSTNLMKALRFAEFGPPSVLRIEEVAIPEPGEGEALVHVKAAAINPSDIGNVAGRFKKTTLPRTPGRDFAGVVVKGKQHEGEEVWGSSPKLGIVRDGSHAEYVVVPAETLSLKPKSLSMTQAAAIGVPYITAWASVVNAAQIQAGETILIVGAAGAVGQAATQIPVRLALARFRKRPPCRPNLESRRQGCGGDRCPGVDRDALVADCEPNERRAGSRICLRTRPVLDRLARHRRRTLPTHVSSPYVQVLCERAVVAGD